MHLRFMQRIKSIKIEDNDLKTDPPQYEVTFQYTNNHEEKKILTREAIIKKYSYILSAEDKIRLGVYSRSESVIKQSYQSTPRRPI